MWRPTRRNWCRVQRQLQPRRRDHRQQARADRHLCHHRSYEDTVAHGSVVFCEM